MRHHLIYTAALTVVLLIVGCSEGGNNDKLPIDDVNLPQGSAPARFRFCEEGASGAVIEATPADYKAKLATMLPGDTLQLAAGSYPDGLPIFDMNGSVGKCFIIDGASTSGKVVFTANASRNTVSIKNSSYAFRSTTTSPNASTCSTIRSSPRTRAFL